MFYTGLILSGIGIVGGVFSVVKKNRKYFVGSVIVLAIGLGIIFM